MKRHAQSLARLIFAALVVMLLGAWGCANGGVMQDDEPVGGGPIDTAFDDWDDDDDGLLSESEFEAGLDDKGVFGEFDQNDDERLDEQEFTVSAQDYGLQNVNFNTFDNDNDDFVENNEFERGLFNTYDVDESGTIETDEFAPGLI